MKLAIILAMLSTSAFANCFKVKPDTVSIKWTAYKTPSKAGVSGSFKNLSLNAPKKSSVKEVISGTNFTIDTMTVFTKNPARDKKISKSFFSTMTGGTKIIGDVKKITDKKVTVDFTINGVTKSVPLAYTIKDNKMNAKGVIDVLDFAMNSQLAAINKACFKLHEGKTWSDVALEVNANFETCK